MVTHEVHVKYADIFVGLVVATFLAFLVWLGAFIYDDVLPSLPGVKKDTWVVQIVHVGDTVKLNLQRSGSPPIKLMPIPLVIDGQVVPWFTWDSVHEFRNEGATYATMEGVITGRKILRQIGDSLKVITFSLPDDPRLEGTRLGFTIEDSGDDTVSEEYFEVIGKDTTNWRKTVRNVSWWLAVSLFVLTFAVMFLAPNDRW